ncbi:hypothetical protein KDN32_07400 [Nocardioides sp. J2M5]|uniref:class F sortase n=1 Tax=Nocardioides palaemonis TaxID=2829810 RepID=UPI001BAB2CCD|nr:class F sortase [Nocardioides palaemonis]MBS2937564.1 hypothetical protein [Nocardioides palaemonis]
MTRALLPVLAGTMVATVVGCAGDLPTPERTGAPTARTSTAPAPGPTTEPAPVRRARRAPSVVVPQPPDRAVLPSGRSVDVRVVGTTPDGLLAVPRDIEVAGWWRGGSRVGDPFGATLLAAHVDSTTQGLGPFAELLTVGRGARVELRAGELRQVFEVRSRTLVPQGPLTDHPELFDASGRRRLVLVTCAPPYDASRGGYQNLAVLTAAPLGPPEAP